MPPVSKHPPLVDGQRFGSLVLIRPAHPDRPGDMWIAQCDCGNRSKPRPPALRSGMTTTCGKCRDAKRAAKQLAGIRTPLR